MLYEDKLSKCSDPGVFGGSRASLALSHDTLDWEPVVGPLSNLGDHRPSSDVFLSLSLSLPLSYEHTGPPLALATAHPLQEGVSPTKGVRC